MDNSGLGKEGFCMIFPCRQSGLELWSCYSIQKNYNAI